MKVVQAIRTAHHPYRSFQKCKKSSLGVAKLDLEVFPKIDLPRLPEKTSTQMIGRESPLVPAYSFLST